MAGRKRRHQLDPESVHEVQLVQVVEVIEMVRCRVDVLAFTLAFTFAFGETDHECGQYGFVPVGDGSE